MEARVEGESVEADREELGGAREQEGGARRAAAVEGIGRRVAERVGGARRAEAGFGAGGISDFRFAFELGRRGGGGIMGSAGDGDMAEGGNNSVEFESDVVFVA